MKKITLGYSPCPNDTFIFYALVHGRIDTSGLSFIELLDDVETLNLMARNSALDITKVSFHAFGHLRGHYCLLRSGGAIGKGCGPLLVAKRPYAADELRNKKIAIPGRLTTAALLLGIFDPLLAVRVIEMPFHEIIGAVVRGEVDAGLIIHESRFTYQQAGLVGIVDLGRWWEEETGLPIPLGAIIGRRDLGDELIQKVEGLIRLSVEYAFNNPNEPASYIKRHAQELDEEVIRKHIALYVNDYSLDIGDDGLSAVEELFRRAAECGAIEASMKPLCIARR